uniref:Uncharacterized protein n=1 Tax=Eptatretus burgeri TaxID=7764 RepID=A0A8C4QN62_EPTBU
MMFDMRTGVVLAQTSNQENIKEKVTAVRTIVPMRSKNEVLLILQHFDYSVDRTVQAFLEGMEDLEPEVKVEAEPATELELDLDSIVSSATSEEREIEQVSSIDVLSGPLENLSLSQGEPAHLQASISFGNMHGMQCRYSIYSIEKSVKDLQRCTVSLNRYRLLVKQEIDVSIKKIKVSFYDVQQRSDMHFIPLPLS